MRMLTLSIACWLLMTTSVAATGEGRIVPQQGIGGLRLGMTEAQVKAKAGSPKRVERGNTEIGGYTTFHYPTFTVTFFAGPRVTQMRTISPKERTISGIGVGSTRSAVAAKVPGAKCLIEFGYNHCYVGAWKPGRTITDFSIQKGRVARITIGYVID